MIAVNTPADTETGTRSGLDHEDIPDGEQTTVLVTPATLLEQAQAGDKSAFEGLYALLSGDIQRYVRRLISSPSTVEDIVQDTFVSLYLNLDKVQSASHLRPYVYRIARNNCYDVLREWGRREHISVDEETATHERLMFEMSHTQHSPEDAAHWMLMLVEVQSLIDSLPENQRETLILYSEEGMTYTEIADVMEVSIGTVKSRLFHAKRTLRRMVNPDILVALQTQSPPETENQEITQESAEGNNNDHG